MSTMSSGTEGTILSGGPLEVPHLKTSLGRHLIACMRKNRDKILQVCPLENISRTNEQVRRLTINVALEMRARGVRPGDVVTVCGDNHSLVILPVLAAMYLGAATNVLHKLHMKRETQRLLERSQPQLVFCDADCEVAYREMAAELKLEMRMVVFQRDMAPFLAEHDQVDTFEAVDADIHKTPAIIMCSSGSTGHIKGIIHTHKTLYCAAASSSVLYQLEDEVVWTLAPICWGVPVLTLIGSIIFGYTRVFATLADNERLLQIIRDVKVTWLLLSPARLHEVVNDAAFGRRPLPTLRTLLVGGSPVTAEQLQRYRATFPDVTVDNAYGATEVLMVYCAITGPDARRLAPSKGNSGGRLCAGVSAKVVDRSTGAVLPRNVPGEMYVKAASLAAGYYREPQADADSFDADGWFKTGDEVYFDDDDFLFVSTRFKESIKYQVYPVIPAEIEDILLQHPEVQSCCVMGLPHEIDGEHPMAFVVRKPGGTITELELVKFVEENVNDVHRLRGGVRFLDEMPMTASGKVRRSQLQKLL